MSRRIKLEEILMPGSVVNTGLIDFNDPKNKYLIELFEITRKNQEEAARLRDQEIDYDFRINI
jgi:hypothetical protein